MPPGGYQAILIDEGQDFADAWYQLLLRALDPETNRLFIAFDSSQNIYKRRISWRSLGVQIVGHTRVLKRNYRNTAPILSAAYHMIRELDAAEADPSELTSALVVPDQALRSGPAPVVACLDSMEAERRYARDWIKARLQRAVAPGEILIAGYSRPGMKEMAAWLCNAGIDAAFLPDGRADGAVAVSTIHSSKGLDAAHVLMLSAHELDNLEDDERRRLLYIAMTRARDELCISAARPSRIVDEITRAVQAGPGP